MRHTIQTFIAKARQVHGDKYDYSAVEYVNNKVKVTIICPEHGPFEQRPNSHISHKHGCPKCGKISRGTNNTLTTEEFIAKARRVHGNRYDYSMVEYYNTRKLITIICPEHGPFEQRPNNHLSNHGCLSCSGIKKHTTQTFITKARQVHGDRYDYSMVEYTNCDTKVTIICPEHGPFEQIPYTHMNGIRCPGCAKIQSKQEIELLDFISTMYDGKIISNTRSVITPYELDVYIPDKQIAFEYNGNFWHLEGITKPIGYHQMKTDMCKNKGIALYHIWEDDWVRNNNQVMEMIANIL
jgi:hypothetical protein